MADYAIVLHIPVRNRITIIMLDQNQVMSRAAASD